MSSDGKRSPGNSESATSPATKKSRLSFDDSRRKEIRETNRVAARECRARKKRLMVELEKTVANLTSEHTALMKQNRELTIRLETLQRTAAMGIGPFPGSFMNTNSLGGNPMGLLSSLNASLQTNQPMPAIAFPGKATTTSSPGGSNIVVQHLHHYDENGKGVPSSGAPAPADANLRDSLSKLGSLLAEQQKGTSSTMGAGQNFMRAPAS